MTMLLPKAMLQQQPENPSSIASPSLTEALYNSPLQADVYSDLSNIGISNRLLGSKHNGMSLRHADETVSNHLFPPMPPHYSSLTALFYQILSTILSLIFLIFVVACAMIKTMPSVAWVSLSWCRFKNPDESRPLYHREKERKHIQTGKLKCDVEYYAERQGFNCKEYKVETEDGFILTIHHIIERNSESIDSKRKYPVLLLHGLMQSSGAFCVNDESSLAFFLCKSGYDVWLGNNRGYFKPEHKFLNPSNPKFWAWNLRQMGCLDIPALVSFVCSQTLHSRIALVAHSQGTALTFLALAKDQVPHLGESLSCFIALAPAVFAGSLLESFQFGFVKIMSTRLYHIFFGIHSFIPHMMVIHGILPGRMYGWLGYRVFNFLFSWTDRLWERRLRSRFFQFSPVYVSSECMRWWLGRDCFAKQKCVLPNTDTKWYDPMSMPPIALYIGGRDKLVDGRKLIERFEKVESDVILLRKQVDDEFEHLDCIWSIDCIERIGKRVREDIWNTVTVDNAIVPEGCREEDKGSKAKQGKEDIIELN